MEFEPIAIVGQGCVLPGALDPQQFWQGIVDRRVQLGAVPEGRWRMPKAWILAEAPGSADQSSSDIGGYVRDFVLQAPDDLSGADLPESALIGPAYEWILHGARQALTAVSGMDRHRAGIVSGNLSYPTTGLATRAERMWLPADDGQAATHPFQRFSSGLPVRLAARRLGLGLGGLALDAACASSLYAIALACRRLQRGAADLMVAGGVNAADDLFLHVGFSNLGALSRSGRSLPLHREADGLVPAEGAAYVALMRLSDAIASDTEILGVIRGIGLSNDGRDGGPLVPSELGQRRAMESAYRSCGVAPESVGLLECHATGTPVGDAVEIRSTARVFAETRRLPIGSVKANIGHAITAAGAAGLLKVIGAMRAGVRPPVIGADQPSDQLRGTALRLLGEAEDWTGPRRAAVSAFGFGGNNAHLVVDAWTGDQTRGPAIQADRPASAAGTSAAAFDAPDADQVAIVALGARVGSGTSVADLRDALLGGRSDLAPRRTAEVDLDGLRCPPADLKETLAQQLLMLESAREAARSTSLPADRTMVVIGMGCDPESARSIARWRVPFSLSAVHDGDPAGIARLRDAIVPAQSAAAVVGAMPNMVANRIGFQLGLTGPAFTVSAEEASGTVALEIAAEALRTREVDAALVGAVDMSHEPVHQQALTELGRGVPPGDAAVALVVKRLSDARALGEPVLAVLRDHGPGAAHWSVGDPVVGRSGDHFDPGELFGRPHAASGLLSVVAATLSLYHRARPRAGVPSVPACQADDVTVCVDALGGGTTTMGLRAVDAAGFCATPPLRLHVYSGRDQDDTLASLAAGRQSNVGPARLVICATDHEDPATRADEIRRWLRGQGVRPQGVAFQARPIGGEVAFVYSGGSMAYPGLGRELMLAFPEELEQVAHTCGGLRPLMDWAADPGRTGQPRVLDQIGSASVLAQLHTRISRELLGLRPQAAIGHSAGEGSALAALGAWRDVASQLVRARESDLFKHWISGEMEVPRRAWSRQGLEGSGWASYLAEASPSRVSAALADVPGVHLMVVNAPDSCVFGGEATGCERVRRRLAEFTVLPIPYQIAAHVPEAEEVRPHWWEFHHLPTQEVAGVRFYSCVTGTAYTLTAESAANALTDQALRGIDFSATVEQAWRDGVRIFIEHGPGAQCSKWVSSTLGDREHLAVALDANEGRRVNQLFQVAAELVAAGLTVDLERVTERLTKASLRPATSSRVIALPAHPPAIRMPALESLEVPKAPEVPEIDAEPEVAPLPVQVMTAAPQLTPFRDDRNHVTEGQAGASRTLPNPPPPAVAELVTPDHDLYLRVVSAHREFIHAQAQLQQRFVDIWQRSTLSDSEYGTETPAGTLLPAATSSTAHLPQVYSAPAVPDIESTDTTIALSATVDVSPPDRRRPVGPRFSRAELEQLASGPVSAVLGASFAAQDTYRLQTRMPAPPMLLVDRVTGIDAEPQSMGQGVIWTETDVSTDAWYLDPAGRMPVGLMVESGQADLLLISWLGVDMLNRGERCYRLLGCELTFHGSPPEPGETLRYEIHIDGHGEHGGVRLFFFHYDCYAGDELRLSMRQGQAGFFTPAELAGTSGVLWDPADSPPDPRFPIDPPAILSSPVRSFDADQVRAFTEGRVADCFGPQWDRTRTHIRTPHLGHGRMRLIGSVPEYDPEGGPWKRGYLRAETAIAPGDWFFAGHFMNDPCMPGTLMLDGCLQAMAFYLAAGGHSVDRDGWRFEPVPGMATPMYCRGQVTPESRRLTYEVFVSQLSAGPEPTLIADVLCTVDGVKAFHVHGLALRLVPDWPLTQWRRLSPTVHASGQSAPHLPALPGHGEGGSIAEVDGFRYDYAAMLACAWGRPSEAFGPAYSRFDGPRRLARLPGPPFHFLTRAVSVEGPPFVMQPGSAVELEYDVPKEAWYFEHNDVPDVMPLCVLMEVVLQAGGWLASYVGSALTSEEDLLFRNLDGTGTIHREIRLGSAPLRTRTMLRDVSDSGDMIIQTFEIECTTDGVPVFSLTTVFGFFPRRAFEDQVGLPPTADEAAWLSRESDVLIDLTSRPARYFDGSLRLPGPMLLMLDRITGYWPTDGSRSLGRLRAEKDVDFDAWFFKAHFFQDPVQPGSLGVQAMLQLVQVYAIERGLGNHFSVPRVESVLTEEPLRWTYRGQVTPEACRIIVEVEIIEVRSEVGKVTVIADGWLWVDGTRIYHVRGLGLRLSEAE